MEMKSEGAPQTRHLIDPETRHLIVSGGRNRGCGGGRRTALSAHGQIQRGAGSAGPEP